MKRYKIYSLATALMLVCFMMSCSNNKKSDAKQATTERGSVKNDILTGEVPVIVDEAVLPIIQEQIDVFKESYTEATVRVIALPEREAINALIKDQGAIAILSRELTKEESTSFDHRQIKPRVYPIFYDGVVFVNNISEPDTSIQVQTLTSMLTGSSSSGKTLVFDNINSSTFRRVKEFTSVQKVSSEFVKGMKNSSEVMDFLEKNPNTIGVISYGQYLEYRRKFGEKNNFRILSLQNDKGGAFKPSQSTFATDEYPLKTEFFVLNYQPNMGLGIGFSAFLTGDRGQRVVLKSGLLPVTMPGRQIIIRDNIN